MAFRGVITYVNSPEMAHRQFLRVVSDANAAAIEHWWERDLPAHFTVEGGRRYGYQPRSGDNEGPRITSVKTGRSITNPHYSWKKRRIMHHNKPLVYSGDAERSARQRIRITSSSNKAAGVLTMPKYFYQYRKDLQQPDKSAEVIAVTEPEVGELADFHGKTVHELMGKIREAAAVTV